MLTYQDLIKRGDDENERMDFVTSVINEHKASDEYKTAETADLYYRQQNVTISELVKLLYTVTGKQVPDNISTNYKLKSNFYFRFITELVQYVLGNGVTWKNPEEIEKKLGKDFDSRISEIFTNALNGRVCYGFFNLDHVEVFPVYKSGNRPCFHALFDEESGAISAGVRYWQLDTDKPLRATLYEPDGYTEYIFREGKGEIYKPKRSYKTSIKGDRKDVRDNTQIIIGENYPTFPIVPLYSPREQSEIVSLREAIDAYDLIKSGYCTNVDEADYIYWVLNNAGGMGDEDLEKFIERMKTIHAAQMDGDVSATPHQLNAPYAGREALLERLRRDMYEDFMVMDNISMASGAATATHIRAAYEAENAKACLCVNNIIDFVQKILELAGIDDDPVFTFSPVVNTTEEVQRIIAEAQFMPSEYITEKLVSLNGDKDRLPEILDKMNAESMALAGLAGGQNGQADDNIQGGDNGIAEPQEALETAQEAKGTMLNGAQTQSLLVIMSQLSEGTLNENQAVNIISTAIGVSKDKAREIIRGE